MLNGIIIFVIILIYILAEYNHNTMEKKQPKTKAELLKKLAELKEKAILSNKKIDKNAETKK